MVGSSALVLFHRFYTLHSFKKHDRNVVSASCIFLASKIEEKPLRLKELVNAIITNRRKINRSSFSEAVSLSVP